MAKYKVVIGTHIEGGKAYSKGQIVNSSLDLAKLFPGKFTKPEYAEPEPDPAPRPSAKGEPDWEEPAAAPVKATKSTKSKAH